MWNLLFFFQSLLDNTLESIEAGHDVKSWTSSSPSTLFQNHKPQVHKHKLHLLLVLECFYVNLQSLMRMFGCGGCRDRNTDEITPSWTVWDRLWRPQDRCYKKMREWISEAPWPSYMPPGTSERRVWCGEKTIGLMVKVGSVIYYLCNLGLPRWLSDKESTCQARDMGLIPGLERSPGEGNGNPLQYSCLGNPLDRGACRATVYGVTKSRTCFID